MRDLLWPLTAIAAVLAPIGWAFLYRFLARIGRTGADA